jgi:hypothetical protein
LSQKITELEVRCKKLREDTQRLEDEKATLKEMVESRDELLMEITSVIPRSEKEGTKPPYVCPGFSNHTYSNNMIIRFRVQ